MKNYSFGAKAVIVFFLFFTNLKINAQGIYLNTSDSLYRFNINSCTLKGIMATGSVLTDIAITPDGNIHGVTDDSLFRIDTATANLKLIHVFADKQLTALISDNNGLLYTAGSSKKLSSFNVKTNVEKVYGNIGFASAGDLTFYKGDMYMMADGNRIIKVDINNPSNSSLYYSFSTLKGASCMEFFLFQKRVPVKSVFLVRQVMVFINSIWIIKRQLLFAKFLLLNQILVF